MRRFNIDLESIQPVHKMNIGEWSGEHEGLLKKIIDTICPDFVYNTELNKLYFDMAKYFCGDNSVYDTEKGIYLYGKYGVGKTLFFKVMSKFVQYSGNYFVMLSADRLVDLFHKEGFDVFDRICAIQKNDATGIKPINMFMDDMGQGAKIVKHYGSETNVMVEYLQRRYRVFTDAYKLTHISTNLEPTEIRDLYGEYISSRFKEMFNTVLMPGKDMRR